MHWQCNDHGPADMYELATYLAHRSGIRRLVQIGSRCAEQFARVNSPFDEIICIDTPEMKDLVQSNAPSTNFIACDFERALTDQIKEDIFSGSVVVCSGILERLSEPERLASELAKLRIRCSWQLLSTPDRVRVQGLLDPAPTNCAHTTRWTADEFGRFLIDCGFSRNMLIGYAVNNAVDSTKSTVLVVAGNEAEYVESPRRLKIAAIINVFNEADVIETVVRHLASQEIQVHLIDNWSSDGTYELGRNLVALGFCSKISRFPDQPSSDYEWARQLDHTAQYAASLDADWIIHHDADEIRLSPWPNVPLARAIEYVDGLGYTALDFTVVNFFYTDDGKTGKFVPEQLKWFEWGRHPSYFVQVKAWKHSPDVNLSVSGGHNAEFEGRRVYPIKFLTRHYPLRSQLQANQKIFRDRFPRIEKERRERDWHVHYDAFRSVQEIKHWRQFELKNFDPNMFSAEYLVERISGIGVEHEARAILNCETIFLEMERMGREVATTRSDVAEIEGAIRAKSAEMTRLHAELKHLRSREAELLALLEARGGELRSTKASVSWRITRPLRMLGHRFPRLAGQVRRSLFR